MADKTLKRLKKENEEMKSELDDIYKNRKANNLIASTIFALFMAVLFGTIMLFATVGAETVIKELAFSEVSAAFLRAFMRIANLTGYIFIGWHWFIVFVMNFHEELIQAGKEIRIYVQAGRKALSEASKGKDTKENPKDEPKKKASKPRKKPAHGKDGKFAKKPKPSVTPPPPA